MSFESKRQKSTQLDDFLLFHFLDGLPYNITRRLSCFFQLCL